MLLIILSTEVCQSCKKLIGVDKKVFTQLQTGEAHSLHVSTSSRDMK